jgi:hypothetical protein
MFSSNLKFTDVYGNFLYLNIENEPVSKIDISCPAGLRESSVVKIAFGILMSTFWANNETDDDTAACVNFSSETEETQEASVQIYLFPNKEASDVEV